MNDGPGTELPILAELRDALEAHMLAGAAAHRANGPRRRAEPARQHILGFAVLAGGTAVALLLAVLLLTAGHARQPVHRTAAAPAQTQRLRQLLAEYAFLRRPPTAAERAIHPTNVEGFGQVVVRQPFRAIVSARVLPVPGLVRRVVEDGVAVDVFVVRVDPYRVLPPQASRSPLVLRKVAGISGLRLYAQVEGGNTAQASPGPPGHLMTAERAPGQRIFSVVPDDVRSVRWSLPRLFDARTLSFAAASSVTATVHDNLAVAPALRTYPPSTATWIGAGGQVLRVIRNPDAGGAQFGVQHGMPGPETPLSRAAERDPSTPNRVVIVATPQFGGHDAFSVLFHVLVDEARYGFTITGGPHPGCVREPYPFERKGILGGPPAHRGDTFQGYLDLAGSCPGTYTVSVSVRRGATGRYPPFGTATLTIR